MSLVMTVPLLVSAVLGLAASRLVRWLPPATAVPLLTVGALAASLSTGLMLCVAALVALAQVACRRLGPGVAGLVVVDDDHPDAYALPGLGGRVVVSTAMLRALPADERRALLAHEVAHLRCRHHAYLQLADLAAAANPMLRPVSAAVRTGIERWADEHAATRGGDRALVARALARASLAQHQSPTRRPPLRLPAAMAAADSPVLFRTRALLAPPPQPRPVLAAVTAAVVLCAVGAATLTARDTEHRFEVAHLTFHQPR